MRRTFPTTRDHFPKCPHCDSTRVGIALLTFYTAYFHCEDCDHSWNVENAGTADDDRVRVKA